MSESPDCNLHGGWGGAFAQCNCYELNQEQQRRQAKTELVESEKGGLSQITHTLKTKMPFFQQVWKRTKTAEIRKDDRNFRVGDRLKLVHYGPGTFSIYKDCFIMATISEITHYAEYPDGLKPGFVMLSLKDMVNHSKGAG